MKEEAEVRHPARSAAASVEVGLAALHQVPLAAGLAALHRLVKRSSLVRRFRTRFVARGVSSRDTARPPFPGGFPQPPPGLGGPPMPPPGMPMAVPGAQGGPPMPPRQFGSKQPRPCIVRTVCSPWIPVHRHADASWPQRIQRSSTPKRHERFSASVERSAWWYTSGSNSHDGHGQWSLNSASMHLSDSLAFQTALFSTRRAVHGCIGNPESTAVIPLRLTRPLLQAVTVLKLAVSTVFVEIMVCAGLFCSLCHQLVEYISLLSQL